MTQTGDDATIIQAVEMTGDDAVVLGSIPVTGKGTYRISFQPTGSSVQLWVLGAYDMQLKPTCYTYPVTTQETYLVDICDENKDRYRFGFNGQEKVNELKGIGNSLDFGSRIYDSRGGRWLSMDSRHAKSPYLAPYHFGADNPIIYVDPDGNTEFYFSGKWIGRDGTDNNAVGIIKNEDVAKQMIENSKNGKLNQQYGDLKHGDKLKGVGLVVNRDVLATAYEVFELSLSKLGKQGEYSLSMQGNTNNNNYNKTAAIAYSDMKGTDLSGNSATSAEIPDGDVSIHSHPTGWNIINEGKENAALNRYSIEPSQKISSDGTQSGDVYLFTRFKMNIIVGKRGPKLTNFKNAAGEITHSVKEGEEVINFYDENSKDLIRMSASEVKDILSGPDGKTYKNFNKMQTSKSSNATETK